MKLSVALRTIALGAVAFLSAGCVDGGYREGYYDRYPRVVRDDYDRGYRRPDYLYVDRSRYGRNRIYRDRRFGGYQSRSPFNTDARGRLAPGSPSRPRIRFHSSGRGPGGSGFRN